MLISYATVFSTFRQQVSRVVLYVFADDSGNTSISLFSREVCRLFQTVKRRVQTRRRSQHPMRYKMKANHKRGTCFDTKVMMNCA
jgi:hypothetical protein